MTIYPILIDAPPTYLAGGARPAAALEMPLGAGRVLEWLQAGVAVVTDEPWTLLTHAAAEARPAAERAALKPIERVAPLGRLAPLLECFEPADQWLLLDLRRLPTEWSELRRLAAEVRRARAAGHLVLSAATGGGAQEVVHVDEAQRVRCVQRYYAGVTWHRAEAVVASLISVSALRQANGVRLTDLAALRQRLTAAGVVSRDIASEGGAVDLTQEAGLLRLNAQALRAAAGARSVSGADRSAGVHCGSRATVHSTARLYGPVVLQDDACVAEDAVIVGPTVVGAGSRVGRGAVVVQCVLGPGTTIPDGSVHRQCVRTSDGAARPATSTADLPYVRSTAADSLPPEDFERVSAPRRPIARPGRRYARVKPVLEATVAALALLALLPLLVATALAVKLTSRGPVLFGHIREGRGGRPFRCWKFRTMVHDAHRQQRALYRQNEVDGPQFKLRRDPRITRLGHWLRHTNLDELPQLINVAAGQMSLIGPRPSPFRENQICVPWRRARLSVRPGITGLWQICRHERAAGDFHQWIHYDMLYVRHLSLGLDLRILLATLLTFGGRWSVPVTWLIPARRLRAPRDVAPAYPAGHGLAAE